MSGPGELVFLGCYTAESGGRGEGIMAARRDRASGVLTLLGTVAVTPSPSFLARHPALPVLYAVNEVSDGTVSAWRITGDGALDALGSRSTGGDSPCHVAVAPDGGHLFVANYGSGSVAAYPLDDSGVPGERSDLVRHSGSGPDPDRQEGPHAHMVSPDPSDGTVLAVDLGTDTVYRYAVTPPGRLLPSGSPVSVPPGTGPRHLTRHPDRRRWFVAGELDATVRAYEWVEDGARERGRVPASGRTGHVQPSEIALAPDGRHLHLANRGIGTLSTFALDRDGELRHVAETDTGGPWPRHFAFIGDHLYVADERADLISVFVVDPATGVPSPVGGGSRVAVPSPTCVLPDLS